MPSIGERARVERTCDPLPSRPDVRATTAERTAALERLMTWATSHGARSEGFAVEVDANGNAAVRASRTLVAGERILSLPRRLMIIDNELATSTTGVPALGLHAPRPRDGLAAWLPLELRQPASRWRAYLETLPDHLAELPMFRGADDLAALEGTAAYALATVVSRDVLDTYEQLAPDHRARLSLAEFAWGCAIVRSRAFHAPGSTDERIALLPIVDLFNHGLGDTTWSFDPLDGNFVVMTEHAFARGDEVHFPYSECSNTRLLIDYGFTLPNNPANEAHLLFDRPGEPPIRMRVACVLDDRFVRALSLARFQAASPVERARAQEIGVDEDGGMPWLGSALEEAAFAVMGGAARRALDELDAHPPHTVETEWQRHCQAVRDSERAVLEQIVELTSMVREYLQAEGVHIRAAAAAISVDATGARRALRQYLVALGDEVTR